CVCPPESSADAKTPLLRGKIVSSRSLFKSTLQGLKSDNDLIRSAVILGLSRCNRYSYRALVEEMQLSLQLALEDSKSRSQKSKKRLERMRMDIAHIHFRSAELLSHESAFSDDSLFRSLLDYIM